MVASAGVGEIFDSKKERVHRGQKHHRNDSSQR